MWFHRVRFMAQQNNNPCCAWFLFNDALCRAAKTTEGQLSMDGNVRPHSGCITSTREVKQYLLSNQGACVMESSEQGQGRCWSMRSWQGQPWGQHLQDSWGTEAASVWTQHLQNSVQTRPPHKSTNKKVCSCHINRLFLFSRTACRRQFQPNLTAHY